MCTHQRKIYNHYIGQSLWVNCGRCPACMQEKANARAARIRNHAQRTGEIPLFFGLTYDDESVPYILKKSCSAGADVPVYRGSLSRYVGSGCDVHLKRIYETQSIGYFSLKTHSVHKLERMDFPTFDYTKLPSVRYDVKRNHYKLHQDRTSVCFFKDWQDFYKRLQINLKRNENINEKLSYFVCSEYGGRTKRCHFHVLLFCRPEIKESVIRAIYKSWPYSDSSNKRFDVQVARSAASYVASYVNTGGNFPRLLKEFMPPKHSYSQNFGLDSRFFELSAVLSAIKQGSLVYPVTRLVEGRSQPQFLPIPKYVLSRYFPRWKGFSNMSDSEIFRVVLSPKSLLGHRAVQSYSELEVKQYACRLRNAYDRFRRLSPSVCRLSQVETGFNDTCAGFLSIYDYAYWFVRCWSAYRSTLIRQRLHLINENPYNYWSLYDNIMDYHSLDEIPSLLKGYYFMSPNDTPLEIARTKSFQDLYDKCDKSKNINNEIYSTIGYDV